MLVLGLSANRQLALARTSDMLTLSVTDDRLEVRTEARITTPGKVTFAKWTNKPNLVLGIDLE